MYIRVQKQGSRCKLYTDGKVKQVKIYLGAATVEQISQPAALVFLGSQPNSQLGYALDPAGDLNGDGYDDLVAGAPETTSPLRPGFAEVWFGQASRSSAPAGLTFHGELGADRFGWDVSGAGDVNGDGYDDLLVGAPEHDASGTDRGAVYLFRGGSFMDTQYDWKAEGGTGGDRLGYAVDGGFDWSGDGVPDLAAGAPRADDPASNAGEVRIYFGGSTLDPDADRVLPPAAPVTSYEANDHFGSAVRFVGSFNGTGSADDARAELLVSAPEGNTSQSGTAGYVDFVTEPGTYTPVRVLSFEATAARTGVRIAWRLSDAGEVTGLRVDAVTEQKTRPVNPGWLPPQATDVVDEDAGWGSVEYRLVALQRDGETSTLATTVFPGERGILRVSPPDRNPFRGSVRFHVSAVGAVSAVVCDVRGRVIRRLLDGVSPAAAGLDVVWDGADAAGTPAPAGLYFVRVESARQRAAFKLVRLP